MNRFAIKDLPLPGLKLVERVPIGDARGSLTRVFCAKELGGSVWPEPIVQINQTLTSVRGTVRGLHYQRPPHCEKKLVVCTRGKIWDVAVDLRKGSPTFLQWHAEILSPENHCALLIPEGFAHGLQTLCDGVEMLYFHSTAHHPEAESGLSPLDPRLGISWPEEITALSDRDKTHPFLSETFAGVDL